MVNIIAVLPTFIPDQNGRVYLENDLSFFWAPVDENAKLVNINSNNYGL